MTHPRLSSDDDSFELLPYEPDTHIGPFDGKEAPEPAQVFTNMEDMLQDAVDRKEVPEGTDPIVVRMAINADMLMYDTITD